jgi:hypothetical protein
MECSPRPRPRGIERSRTQPPALPPPQRPHPVRRGRRRQARVPPATRRASGLRSHRGDRRRANRPSTGKGRVRVPNRRGPRARSQPRDLPPALHPSSAASTPRAVLTLGASPGEAAATARAMMISPIGLGPVALGRCREEPTTMSAASSSLNRVTAMPSSTRSSASTPSGSATWAWSRIARAPRGAVAGSLPFIHQRRLGSNGPDPAEVSSASLRPLRGMAANRH